MKKWLLSLVLLHLAIPASAQEIHGYFDFYFQNADSQQQRSAGRIFDARNNLWQLNMAEISITQQTPEVLFKADLAFGEMTDALMSTPNADASKHLPQATLKYTPIALPQFTLTAGKFYSYLGYEVTRAKENFNYSRSYIYNFGIPFWHEGLSLTYKVIPSQWTASIYLLNAWDGRIANEQNKSATQGASFNWTPLESLSLIYNYIEGSESTDKSARRRVHEVNGSYQLNPHWTLAFDVIDGLQKKATASTDASWTAWAIYAKYNMNTWYSLSTRYELYDDSDGGFTLGTAQKINSLTFTNNFTLSEGLETRLEYRHDKSNITSAYFKNSSGSDASSESTAAVALLYGF